MLQDCSCILFIALVSVHVTKKIIRSYCRALHIFLDDCIYTNDDNIDMPQSKGLRLLDGVFDSQLSRMKGREYLHQACLGSGSIYFVWGKCPMIGRVVQDCVRPTHHLIQSFQWRQHNTRQHKHVSYIDVQCWALMVPMRLCIYPLHKCSMEIGYFFCNVKLRKRIWGVNTTFNW